MNSLLRLAAPTLLGLLAASCASAPRERSVSFPVDPGDEIHCTIRHARKAVVTSSGPGTVVVEVDGCESTARWTLAPGVSAPLGEHHASLRVGNASEHGSNVAIEAKGGWRLDLDAEVVPAGGGEAGPPVVGGDAPANER